MNRFEQDVYNRYMEKSASPYLETSIPGVLGAISGSIRGGISGGLLGGISGSAINPLIRKFKGDSAGLLNDMKRGFMTGGKWGGIVGAVRGGYEGNNNVDTIYKSLIKKNPNDVKNSVVSALTSLAIDPMYNPTGLTNMENWPWR